MAWLSSAPIRHSSSSQENSPGSTGRPQHKHTSSVFRPFANARLTRPNTLMRPSAPTLIGWNRHMHEYVFYAAKSRENLKRTS